MNKLLKILGFIGSLAAGIAVVSYFIESSKSDASSAVAAQASAQTIKSENQSKKISRLAKIEQNYQPKAFEEIPVEYVQIAKSDIDEGKKLPIIDSSSAVRFADKVVQVEQGASSPFLSSRNSQSSVPVQSEQVQAVNPQENYYPGSYYDHGTNHTPRNNKVSHDNVEQSPIQVGPSQFKDSVGHEQSPKQKKHHFRSMNDDLSSSDNTEYNPSMLPVKQELQNSEQPVNPQMPEVQNNDEGTKFDWKNLLNELLNSVGSFAGYKALDYLYNKLKDKLTGQAEPSLKEEQSLDDHTFKLAKIDPLPESTNTNGFNTNPTSGLPICYEPEQTAQSTKSQEPKTTEHTQEKTVSKSHKVESKKGVANMNKFPSELPVDKGLNHIGSGQKTEILSKARRPGLNVSHVEQTEMQEASPVALEQKKIELLESRKGVVETINPQEIIELPVQESVINESMPKSRSGINQGQQVIELSEKVDFVSSENKKMQKLESRKGIVEIIHPEEVEILIEHKTELLPEQVEGKSVKQMHEVSQEDIIQELSVQDSISNLSAQNAQLEIPCNNESYFNKTWNYFFNKNTAASVDRLLASHEGGAVLALGAAAVAAVPCLALSALTTAVAPAVAAPALAAPIVTSTSVTVPAVTATATSLMSYASGAKALMLVKGLAGIAGFALTKNPVYLLPK